MKTLAIVKFGGSLVDFAGTNIPLIVERISELKKMKDRGPITVFSAPKGVTDNLQAIGESKALSRPYDLDSIFSSYSSLSSRYLKESYLEEFNKILNLYKSNVEETLAKVDKRFNDFLRARILTTAGELLTAVMMSYILNSEKLHASFLDKTTWPIVTDDNFENATPDFEMSSKNLPHLLRLIEEERIISIGGFMGVTHDGLETLLGRGGSDQTAVFLSLLLKDHYEIETILFKETPVQSADPRIVKEEELRRVHNDVQ